MGSWCAGGLLAGFTKGKLVSDAVDLGIAEAQERLQDSAINQLVQSQQLPINRAIRLRIFRRVSWSITADKLQRRFERAAREARHATPWEHLHVSRDDASRSVHLFFGNHPISGIVNNDIEVGASLVISQDALGGVGVLFFPFESLNVRQSKPKLIWGYYDEPQQIYESEIRRMLKDFFIYSRATSALMGVMRCDQKHVEKLEHRSRMFEGGANVKGLHRLAVAILVVGSITTAAVLVAWIVTEKSSLEPWAGLVALTTGWIAAWVQRSRVALDRQLSKAMDIEKIEGDERDRRMDKSGSR